MNNGNFYQQGMYGMYGQQPTYGYSPESRLPKIKNILTPEEMSYLQKNANQFTLGLTNEEVLKSQCNHRKENGELALVDRADGYKMCTVCGEVFKETDLDANGVATLISELNDVIQTIKLMYYDFPTQAAKEYYQIIPLIAKLPKLMEIASDNFSKYQNIDGVQQNGYDPVSMFSNFITGGYPMMAGMAMPNMGMNPMMGGMPNMGMPQGQPMMNQGMPQGGMMNPNMGMGMNPMGGMPQGGNNPFYGQQTQGYQPTTQGYNYDVNNAQAAAAQQGQPAQTQAPTDVKVNASLQA